jgi:hypothetical protein
MHHHLALMKSKKMVVINEEEEDANLSDRLSVVITTSPVPDNPSTLMLSKVLSSFQSHLSPSLHQIHLILICDGAKPFTKSEPKSGRVTEQELENYELFKKKVRELLLDWSFGESVDEGRAEFDQIERVVSFKASRWDTVHMQVTDYFSVSDSHDNQSELSLPRRPRLSIAQVPCGTPRLGFGLSIEFSLRFLVKTPLALIAQHDWAFSRSVPLKDLLDLLEDRENRVKYIGFLSSSTVGYEERRAIPQGFPTSWLSDEEQRKLLCCNTYNNLKLQRLYFWYDRTHLARVEDYLSLVFPNTRPVSEEDMKERHAKRGDFIEDTFGHAMMSDLRSLMVEGAEDPLEKPEIEKKVIERHHRKYGCYLWYPEDTHFYSNEGIKKKNKDKKRITLRHLHGRKFHKRSEVMLQAYLEGKAEQERLRLERGISFEEEEKTEDSGEEEATEDIFDSCLFDS